MKQPIQCIVLLVCLMGSALVAAQSQREMYNASVKAYEAKDFSAFLKLTKSLDSLRPFHPTFTYNLASAYALNGNADKAISILERLILMNNTADFEKDADFKSLTETEAFKKLIALKTQQNEIIANSEKVITLSEKALHPEGIVYLPKSKMWLAGSICKRKIITFDEKTGECKDWLTDAGMLAVFALKADQQEQFLWAATSAIPEMENYTKAIAGKAEILKIDIKSKRIVKRFPMEGSHVLGDLVITKDNAVYISDSGKPVIYKIENDQISEWMSLEQEAFNLQGLSLNNDGSNLFVADYLKGILKISLKDRSKHWLDFPKNSSAKGIDGLVFYNNTLMAVQNGVKPVRLTRFQLDASQSRLVGFETIDNNRPEFNEPAQACLVGNSLYFFANSPWNAYDSNGNLDITKFENPMLYRYSLKR